MRDGLQQVARQLASAANQPAQQPLRIASVGQTDETGCQVSVHDRSGMVREIVTHLGAVRHGIDPDRAFAPQCADWIGGHPYTLR